MAVLDALIFGNDARRDRDGGEQCPAKKSTSRCPGEAEEKGRMFLLRNTTLCWLLLRMFDSVSLISTPPSGDSVQAPQASQGYAGEIKRDRQC